LAQAYITQIEANMGYPEHILLAIGHLAEASEECMAISPELSDEIRQYRLLIMEDSQVQIPYFLLFNKVKELIREKGCGSCKKASVDFKERLMAKKEENK
jgi:hypothetical protein